jgi:hypothetical protein
MIVTWAVALTGVSRLATGAGANLALGKTPAASSATSGHPPGAITDGDTNSANWTQIGTTGPQWLRVDLGQTYPVDEIAIWHYAADSRTYHDVIVQLSNDINFASGVTTVFNNDADNTAGQGFGTQAEYAESAAGKDLTFAQTGCRYVRLWTNGNTVNLFSHYVEVQVFASGSIGSGLNLAAGRVPIASSAAYGQALAAVTDGDTNSNNWTQIGLTGPQWIRIDLGQAYAVAQVTVLHYAGDSRSYHDVIVQLSNDPGFGTGVTTVFNNDADNSSGQGVGAQAEYAETAAGKMITFAPVTAQYVRLWSNGSSANAYNHYVEVQVFAAANSVPLISTFSSNPSSITSGQQCTLSWNVSGATALSISGVGPVSPVTTGSASVSPSGTSVYTLTASNSQGSTTATLTVTVAPAPPPSVTAKTLIYFSAHQDDWVLFAGAPAYTNFRDLNARKHVVIAITAGDEGASWDDPWPKHPYILARDHGLIEAFTYGGLLLSSGTGYSVATDGPNGQKVVNGHTIMTFTPTAVMAGSTSSPEPKANLNVVAYFLHLPDGQVNGTGWATHGNVSLEKFMAGTINQISSLDHLTTYTSPADLANTIATIILQEMAPGTTGVAYYPLQDTQSIGNPGDHSDHYQTGRLAETAITSSLLSTCVTRVGYVGYDVARRGRNLSDGEYQGKTMLYGVNTAAISLYGWAEGGWNSGHLAWLPENYTASLSSTSLACR